MFTFNENYTLLNDFIFNSWQRYLELPCLLLVAELMSDMGLPGSGEIADEASGEIELLYPQLENLYSDRAVYSAGTVCNILIQDNVLSRYYM